ncbi:MAG: ProQ/FinO family protein [Alphaproteobacteria bacterium]|nr:ProQ/FinO family protein [Alphaproteobacteria bacterium]
MTSTSARRKLVASDQAREAARKHGMSGPEPGSENLKTAPPPADGTGIERNKATIAELVQHFPSCFVIDKQRKRPLKIGIDRDIQARLPQLTHKRLGAGLRFYTSDINYLKRMSAGAQRVDLSGEPVGEVTEAEAREAAARLAAIYARLPAKKSKA